LLRRTDADEEEATMAYGQALARADAMTGEAVAEGIGDGGLRAPADGPLALEVSELAGPGFDSVSFALRRGEVVGLLGASTSGRTDLAEAIAGLRKPRSGTVRVYPRDSAAAMTLPHGDVGAALGAGIGCVPKARYHDGFVLAQSVDETAAAKRARWLGAAAIASPGIIAREPTMPVAGLTGGTRQKVLMARALARDPTVLVLIDPTLGVDIQSKEVLLAEIDLARDAGRTVMVSSSELDDLRSCDRVFAMFRGRIVKVFPAFWADYELTAAIEGVDLDEA
jgi:simple sugar transport system ATP-binding protein